MKGKSQHEVPVYLTNLTNSSSAEILEPVSFERKKAGGGVPEEFLLQDLIQRRPEILPIAEIDRAYRKPIPVCMELETPREKRIDNVFVTLNGDLVFVEDKLHRNPEARRKVVAQVMEYAENLSNWSFDDFQDAVRSAIKEDIKKGAPLRE